MNRKLNQPKVSCLKPIYENFQKQLAKALLVGTGENTEYKNGRFAGFLKELDQVIHEVGERNIFMSSGISMLISGLEVYLREVFICLSQENAALKNDVIDFLKIKENVSHLSIEEIIRNYSQKFRFQNLKSSNQAFKKIFDLDLKRVLDNPKKKRGFVHPNKNIEYSIQKNGIYDFLIDNNSGGLILRHKIIHESYTPEEGKKIFLVLYEIFKYFSTDMVEKIYNIDFKKISK